MFQMRIIAQVWQDPTVAYDADFLLKTLWQRTNQVALGGPIQEVVRDAINEGYLYVDQFRNILLTWRAFIGLTDSGKATWALVYPHLAGQYPIVGGVVPPE
jgi:hypothetical protein